MGIRDFFWLMDLVNKILKEKCKDKNISWCYQKVTNSS